MKVSEMQVSPAEIEQTLREHPDGIVAEACVCGVPLKPKSNETVPRAWVVLSDKGKDQCRTSEESEKVKRELAKWVEQRLSRYKWLKGGVEIVDEVRSRQSAWFNAIMAG